MQEKLPITAFFACQGLVLFQTLKMPFNVQMQCHYITVGSASYHVLTRKMYILGFICFLWHTSLLWLKSHL